MCEDDGPVCRFHHASGYDMRAETALEVFYQPQFDQHIGAGDSILLTLSNSMCGRLPPQRGNTMSAQAIGLGQRHPQIIQPRRGGTNLHPTRVAPLGLVVFV